MNLLKAGRFTLRGLFFSLGTIVISIAAHAQYPNMYQQNMDFDQRMNAQLQAMQQQNQMAQRQMMQSYVQQNGPQLQMEYQNYVRSTGQQISFEQFVQWHILTQGGRDPGNAMRLQQQQFQANQQANRTVQQGYNSYNQGWQQNQQVMGNTMNRYSQQAIQGNQYYRNPQTGEQVELPYGGQPGAYQNSQGNYLRDQQGNFHQVDPQGYTQELEESDSED